jgi:hypothetical protein
MVKITQEVPAQIQNVSETLVIIGQEPLAQIENDFVCSPVPKINWASHVILMNSKLPLGIRYWYMKEAVEYGWSSNNATRYSKRFSELSVERLLYLRLCRQLKKWNRNCRICLKIN